MRVLAGWLRVALIDLRGDIRRFGILLACLALGVGAIASVGSVGSSLQAAVARDARLVLGGDLEAQLSYRVASPEERDVFQSLGATSETIEALGRAQVEGASAFVAMRAVDENYPLLGQVETKAGDASLPVLLAASDGVHGAVVDSLLMDRLSLQIGDRFRVLEGEFEVRGVLQSVPDQVTQGFQLGIPVLMSIAGLEATGTLKPGVLARYKYKILLDENWTYETAAAEIEGAVAEPAWSIRSPQEATSTLARIFDLFSRFLTIVGLSSLLVGGVGVSNAVTAYVTERQRSIAVMRSLGAGSARISVHFLFQILLLTVLGIGIGAALGALLTLAALPIIGGMLSIRLDAGMHPPALLTAAGFGLLVGFAFAYLPLAKTRTVRPALLFRSAGAMILGGWKWRDLLRPGLWLPLLVSAAGIVALALLTMGRPLLVLWYVLGVIVAFVVLRLAGSGLQRLLRLVPPAGNANLRNALKAIYRPGAPAPTVILSLGLGLALLLLIALIDNNLRNQLANQISREAPSFVMMDLFEDEAEELESLADTDPRIEDFTAAPMMRAAITAMAGRPVDTFEPPEDIAFLLQGEAPITWRETPDSSRLLEGQWWAPDYQGEPLVSLSGEFREMGLKLGDGFEFVLYGETIAATIASFREVDWDEGMNFAILLSPGAIEHFPVSYLGLMKTAEGAEDEVQTMLVRDYPQLVFVPIADALAMITTILNTMSNAVGLVGGLAVASGLLVLAGALAAGRAQREADAVVMKVLGATRGDVVRAYLIEYGVLGALAAIIAAGLGSVGAWSFVTYVMEMEFALNPLLILSVVAGSVALTMLTGTIMTWSALSTRPAAFLRGE